MIQEGFLTVFSDPLTLIFIALGTIIGIIFGAIPGLTATMAIVIFLPFTYPMLATQGISTLTALYIGGISGGLISAILLNIPGTPSSVATCFDGRPMAQKGQGAKALGVAVVFSFIGTFIGIMCLMVLAPLLASVAIKFGPFEYCALSVFALSLVVTLAGKDMIKGLMSAVLGCMIATVGLAPLDSKPRFTFGNFNLNTGFKLLPVLIGIFAITEVMNYASEVNKQKKFEVDEVEIKGFGFTFQEFTGQIKNAFVSAMVGLGIGILPGIGGSVSNVLSYTVSKNTSKHPEKYGTGIIDGIVASETANNATIGGAMIPLLALGIPGDGTSAMLMGGFLIHGISVGPLIFEKSGSIVYGIFFAMLLSAFLMIVFMLLGMKWFIKILKVPKNYLLSIVVTLCVIGAIGDSNLLFDAWGVFGFGLMAYLMNKAGFSMTPLILGFLLGETVEVNLRRVSQLISTTSPFSRPLFLVFTLATISVLGYSVYGALSRHITIKSKEKREK